MTSSYQHDGRGPLAAVRAPESDRRVRAASALLRRQSFLRLRLGLS